MPSSSSEPSTQLLLSLPPELGDHAVRYAQVKKLIFQAVSEVSSPGLGHSVLGSEVTRGQSPASTTCFEPDGNPCLGPATSSMDEQLLGSFNPGITHEIASHATLLEPRLGLSLRHNPDADIPSDPQLPYHIELHIPEQSLGDVIKAARDLPALPYAEDEPDDAEKTMLSSDLIIPLPTNAAFFLFLTPDISSLSELDNLFNNFKSTLTKLAESIALTAIPSSSSARRSFSAYSLTAGNAMILRPNTGGKSDLLTWREIFRLYGEANIFGGVGELSHGDRSIEDAETRLKLFVTLARKKKSSLVLAGSREALEVFLKCNSLILDVKKLELANSEAIRKILQKLTKDSMLPIPTYLLISNEASSSDLSLNLASILRLAKPLSKHFIQTVGEILLPVVPHIDDYSCLICTAIAFKPIRLHCSHFFCVRCLVKLQKRGRADCPMCRAPTVLRANAANVDYALLNFMADWFPIEAREKQRANDREATRELMEEYRSTRKRQRRSDGCRIT